MKNNLISVLIVLITIGFSSCQKCVECTGCPFGVTGSSCVDDYDSKADYEAAVANAEALGCDCKEKLSGS